MNSLSVEKVLITGAGGFIGENLCLSLHGGGFSVRGVLRREQRLPMDLETTTIDDIGPDTDWTKALAGVSHVIHLAAKTHDLSPPSRSTEMEYRSINVLGTKRLVETAAAMGVKRIVLASSVKAQAESTPPEIMLSEEIRPAPIDAYGKSKLEAEVELARLCLQGNMEYVVLRLPLLYGPGVKANMLRLLEAVDREAWFPFGLVRNRRSLLSLGNCVDAINACLTHPDAGNQIFLVSDGRDISTPELIRLIAQAMGKPARLLPAPLPLLRLLGRVGDLGQNILGRSMGVSSAGMRRLTSSLALDPSKLKRVLHWRPPYSVEEGIKDMVTWYEQNRRSEHNGS